MKNVFNVLKLFLLVLFLVPGFSMKTIAQTDWIKYTGNPVLELGPQGSWDGQSSDMGAVVFDGTTYHMYYSGSYPDACRIGHATSVDGITWIKDPTNPVLVPGNAGSWDDFYVYMPCVMIIGSTFHMWYDGFDGTYERVGHAVSTDGSTWTKDLLNPVMDVGSPGSWDDIQVFPMAGSVIYLDNLFHMWYGGMKQSSQTWAIGYATSPDGTNWQKDILHNPVMTNGEIGEWDWYSVIPGSVFYDGTEYKMWYSGTGGNNRWRIGIAYSEDRISWIKDTVHNPVLDYGPSGSWDYTQVYNASVLYDSTDAMYRMWYSGGAFYYGRMGLATSLVDGIDDPISSGAKGSLAYLSNNPNPFSQETTIEFELSGETNIDITIINQLGQQVWSLSLPDCTEGKHQYTWNAGNLPAGIYLIRLQGEGSAAVKKVVKINK